MPVFSALRSKKVADHKLLTRTRRKAETYDGELLPMGMVEYKCKKDGEKSSLSFVNKGLQPENDITADSHTIETVFTTINTNTSKPLINVIEMPASTECGGQSSIPSTPEVLRQARCKPIFYLSPESVDSGFESARLSSHRGSLRSGSTFDDMFRRDNSGSSLCSFDTADAGRAFHERFFENVDDNLSIASNYSFSSVLGIEERELSRRSKQIYDVFLHNRFGRKGKDIAELRNATSVSHVYAGTVLVTDMLNSRLVLYTRRGQHQISIPVRSHSEPWSAVVNSNGTLAVTVARDRCVAVISGIGEILQQFGEGILKRPSGLAVDRKGRYIVTDVGNSKVFIVSRSGRLIRELGDSDEHKSIITQADCANAHCISNTITFNQPRYVCVSRKGDVIVSDSGNHCIKVFDSDGNFIKQFGEYGRKDGQLKFPYGVCADQDDNIIVADHYNNRICLFSPDGSFVQHLVTADKGLCRPQDVSMKLGLDQRLYVTHGDIKAHEILCYKIINPTYPYKVDVKSFV